MNEIKTLKSTLCALATLIPPVVSRQPNMYPFVGAKAVKAKLESSREARELAFVTLFHLQTEFEQEKQETKDRNKRGFMSSHAWHGSRIAKAMIAGETLSDEDSARIDEYAVRYSKQMTAALRSQAIADEPELGVTARQFSVQG